MASGGAEEDDGGIPLDIDNVHMLLQVEQEQIQKRTFTNWINAQLSKRCPPSFVSDLFSDLRDGSQLLNLLEVMSGQPMKRQKGRGVFQQRANIETALDFLKRKSIKLVNINISDIIDGRPSIILGLIWTIVLHCHIEELASTLSFSSCHSSLDSLASLDSWSGSPVPASPVPAGRTSPLHKRFRMSAKKVLLMWVRDQLQRVGCCVSVKDFKSSWRSGEAFLAILCALRPELVDMSLVQSRSNQENLEEAFRLAEKELHIARLLEPQDVDVKDPEEKSIMTYVAQFLQYSKDMPAPDDHLQLFPLALPSLSPVNLPAHFTPAIAVSPLRQVSSSKRAREVTCWLEQAYQELSEAWTATENSSFAEKYHVFQNLNASFTEQRRPVMTLFASIRRCPELSQEQCDLRTAWDRLEEELQKCKAELDSSLPPPLDSVVEWIQRAEAVLTEEGGTAKDHAEAAKEARAQQDKLKTLICAMSRHVNTLDNYQNTDDEGNVLVPPQRFDEIKRRLTSMRVTAKYQGIKLEYQASHHTVLNLLGRLSAKVQIWKAPFKSQETVHHLLQDWHETVERQGLPLILMDALQKLKEKANAYTSKAALGEDSQSVPRQVKEADSEAELLTQAVAAVRVAMERTVSVWETYDKCFTSLQTWLLQRIQAHAQFPATVEAQDMNEWTSCHALLNEAGNLLIEVTETSTSRAMAEQISKVNMQWAECRKRTMFEVSSQPSVGPPCLQTVHSLTQEASWLLRQPLDVSSVQLKANRQKLQLLSKKMADVDLSSLSPTSDFTRSDIENFKQTLPQRLAEAERACGELQRAASKLEGRLAELDHWSTEALDCHQNLRVGKQKGRSALEPTAKVLISRGLQLENQVVIEGQDLRELVTRVQNSSPLQNLSTSVMQDRISEAVSHCQEILGMFSSLGYRQHFETACQPHRHAEAGSVVVARTKHVEQIGNVTLQTQDPNHDSAEIPSPTPQPRSRGGLRGQPKKQGVNTHNQPAIFIPHVQMLIQPVREPVTHIQSPLAQTVFQAESSPRIHPRPISQAHTQASSQNVPILPVMTHAPVESKSPVVSQHTVIPGPEEKESSAPSQTEIITKSRIRVQPATLLAAKTSPKPPMRSEVHLKAQSMARSRLEKARVCLQGRIQHAIQLFSGKEISEPQAKRKKRALKILQPAFLEEFLGAVDGFGAFCTGPQLQDLMLLSDSVRKQWEDVRREMAAFVPLLLSKIREGNQQSFSVVKSETQTNAPHETTDQNDHEPLLQTQVAVEGSAEERAESLREMCDTLTPSQPFHLATDQLMESDGAQEPSDTVLPSDCRGGPPRVNPPPGATGMLTHTLQSHRLPCKQSVEELQPDRSPVWSTVSLQPPGDVTTHKQHTGGGTGTHLKPILRAKEQQLTARLLHIPDSSQKTQTHIQAVVRGNTVESKQEAQWTLIPETAILPQEEKLAQQEVLGRFGMTSVENTTDLMECADDPTALITEKLDQIIRESVDISTFTSVDPRLLSDLKEMEDGLQSEMRKLSEQGADVKTQGPEAAASSPQLHSRVHHLQQLRLWLDRVQSAAQALDHFLGTVGEVKAETPSTLPENQDPGTQHNEAQWEKERQAWRLAMQQKFQAAAELSDSIDSTLKAVGITMSLSQQAVDVERELQRALKWEIHVPIVKEQIPESEKLSPLEIHQNNTIDDSAKKGLAHEQGPSQRSTEEESGVVEAKKSRLEGGSDKAQTWKSEAIKAMDQRGGLTMTKGEEKAGLVRRRVALLTKLREIKRAAEKLELQEPTLPALHHRNRALTELESRLAGHLTDLQYIQDATSQSGITDGTQSRELRDVWEETTKAVTERLEQCNVLTELLKRFQSVRGGLSGTLQRAENTISEQASYMGKDNLQRLHTKVQETKAELSGLGDGIDEFRSVCRQLHVYLRQYPQCTAIPYENEADALMDRWLDISERTDSHLENLHLSLTRWEGVLQLGLEVDSWTADKLAVFAQSLSFEKEEDICALQNEIFTQEENMERFKRRASEIQALLQSSEPPLELQVVETQMRKKIEQLRELVSEAEDVYTQTVAAKGQIAARMAECFDSLQKIQDSLRTLAGSDVTTVLAKLKDVLLSLQTQEEQAESVLEDLRVVASIASPLSLHSLSEDGLQVQETVRHTHQLYSQVEEQTERNIQALDRLQRESEHLELWLHTVEEKAAKEEDVSLLKEEARQQRVKTEALNQLVSSLQGSTLQQCDVVEKSKKLLERYHDFHTNVMHKYKESTQSMVGDLTQIDGSPLGAESSVQSLSEQELHPTKAVSNAPVEGQATIKKTQEEAAVQPHNSDGLADKELMSSYLAQREEACSRVEELQRRTAQLPSVFPWPGTAERRQTGLLVRQLQDETESLQLTVTSLDQQRRELDQRTSVKNWKGFSLDELKTCCSSLTAELKGVCSRLEEGVCNEEHLGQLLRDCQHKLTSVEERMSACQDHKQSSADLPALEALQQEMPEIEKDLLQIVTLKDSIVASSTANAQASLLKEVTDLQNHKGALDNNIRDNLAQITENANPRNQHVKEEVTCVQSALKDLAEKFGSLPGIRDDVIQLKQQWYTIQDLDTSLTELTARVNGLQKTVTQETLPADVMLTVDEVAKDLDSLRSMSVQKKQECADNTADRVSQATSTLQKWSQTVQTEPSSPSQAAVDEGLQLQQALQEVLSERDFLLSCLGKNSTKKLKKRASNALSESTSALETLSKCMVSQVSEGQSPLPCAEMPDVIESDTQQEPQQLPSTPPKINLKTHFDTGTLNADDNPFSSKHGTLFGNNTELVMSNSLSTLNKSSIAPQGNPEPLQEDITSAQESKLTSTSENVSQLLAGQSETCKAVTDAQDLDNKRPDISVTPKKEFSIVLDTKKKTEKVGPDVQKCSQTATQCDAKPADVSSQGLTKKKSELFTTLISPQRNKTDLKKSLHQAAQSETLKALIEAQGNENYCEGVGVKQDKVYTIVLDVELPDFRAELSDAKPTDISSLTEKKSSVNTTLIGPESDKTALLNDAPNKSRAADTLPVNTVKLTGTKSDKGKSTGANVSCKDNSGTHELIHNEVLNSAKSQGTVAQRQLTGVSAEETTFTDVEQQKTVDLCQASASDRPESQIVKVPERQDKNKLSIDEGDLKEPASLEITEDTQRQPQIQESMETERTALAFPASPQVGETAGGTPESCTHRSTMQDVLSGIQSLVERSNIINRTPHIDLNWYLKSSPSESEILLERTVQRILACRYKPAQLDVNAMAKQLQEAEDYRRCVQEQVATLKSTSTARICDPDALKSVEAEWSAALLDASATVQVKAAQLDQVKQYHKQMKVIRAFLEVLTTEKDKMSLNTLGSSALQASKLRALLQTTVKKKDMMEELLQLSSQLSEHLSDAESSGALLAQIGDVQEEWRLLEGSFKRALQHSSSSTTQSAFLIKEAEQLKAKLEALQNCNFQSHDSKSALEFVSLTTDLKLYNQLYQHLQSESDALVHLSLGQKEKDKMKRHLQELRSFLNVTKNKLDTSTYSSGISSSKISRHLQELIIWAKQAENHISIGKKLALFPEEARIQIVEMKKSQTDVWSKRSRMQAEVEQMKSVATDMNKEDGETFKTVDELYEAIGDSLDHVLDTMKKNLKEREKLLFQLANMDAWLAETQAKRDPCGHVDNVSNADLGELESELRTHKLATTEIENQLKLVEAMAEHCRELEEGLSPGESRYLVNRISGLWTELDGLLALEKATSWDLEELIHERTSSDEELSTIQSSLQQISADLLQQSFPLRKESLSTFAHWKRLLMEHQFQVQELQHCQEAKRSSVLCTIGELQDQCKTLSTNALEHEKYLHLREQMEESRDIAKEQIQRAKDETISVGERFGLCQTLLVEIPLVKTQCQEAADQLEAIAQELNLPELDSERQRIRNTVKTLVSQEDSVADDIKQLEAKLLLSMHMSSELPASIELFQRITLELEEAEPVNPDEKAIDIALRRYWVIWRNMESVIRVLEGLATKEKINLENNKELLSLLDATIQECHLQMESLSKARESLKDYQWAAQGAIGFLHNAEATFLSAPGGFLDCTEEQRQTRQALEALENGFQAHILHLVELVPQQPCLSRPKTEQLHISILSQLLVGRAILEAQAQLRLETLQRCVLSKESHRTCHEDIRQRLSGSEAKLSECAAKQVTSYGKCVVQLKRAKLLMEDLRSLAGKIEELRAACPMQGCGVGKDGELGALWRRWVSLRRGVGLLLAHTEQRAEEWKDITKSMEQCCSFLASLQADVPDSSIVSFTQEEPQELLAQAEINQVGLEKEQQALASLEHRLEHALSLSSSQEPISPGPVGKTLVKIQENVRSLKERNLLVVTAAQAEEKERQQVQEEIGQVEQHLAAIHPSLETCSSPNKQQELEKDLSFQKAKLKCIGESVQSRYAEIPADISRRLQEVQLSLQQEEKKLMEVNNPVRKLDSQVVALGSGLEKVKVLLEQKSPTVIEAQKSIKCVWDELDVWHSRLMLLENEVQDLAEEHPDHAHLLMDQLSTPLQLYQNTAQMAEQRTAFLSKIPACLHEFDGIVYSATCWLAEAQTWLTASSSFTTARSLQSHANSLQLVLDDSQRIRHSLQDFRQVLDEISSVCDVTTQREKLDHNDKQLLKTQHKIIEQLDKLLQAAEVVESVEGELTTMEKNVPKIRAILSIMENSNITLTEHLNNRQVILANLQSMRRTLEEMEGCKGELKLPQGAEDSLLVFCRAKLLLQPLEELEQLSQQQATVLENKIKEEDKSSKALGATTVSDSPEEIQQSDGSPHTHLAQEAYEASHSEEEDENESCHSSSSDTLTCSIPEDPEETLNTSDVQSDEGIAVNEPLADLKAMESSDGQFTSEVETNTEASQSELLSVKPGLEGSESENVETGLTKMDPKAEDGEAFGPKTVSAEPQIALSTTPHQRMFVFNIKDTVNSLEEQSEVPTIQSSSAEESQQTQVSPEVPASLAGQEEEDKLNAAITNTELDQDRSLKPESGFPDLHIKSLHTAAAVEDTRLVPVRPIAPFTATTASYEIIEEEDEDLALSTEPHQHMALESSDGQFSSEVETKTEAVKSELLHVNPRLEGSESQNVDTGLTTMDPEAVTAETQTTAAEDQCDADAKLDPQRSPKPESRVSDLHTKSLQTAAAVEDTRLVPVRPIAPFTATTASYEIIEEEDEDLALSIDPHQDMDARNVLKEQSEVTTTQGNSVEESHQTQESPDMTISLAGHEENDVEQPSWNRLYTQISQKLTILEKVKEDNQTPNSSEDGGSHEKDKEMQLISTGSASAVLQLTHESITTLRKMVSSADGSHPVVNEELYKAVRRLLLCMDTLTDFVSTPGGTGEHEPHVRLLQQECVSAELVTLAELLSEVESMNKLALSKEEPEALHCLASLQSCVHTVQLVFTSYHSQLGIPHHHQELSSDPMCLLDEFDLGQSEMFPSIKHAPSLERCVLGRHLRESPGENAKLQQAARALLQGITRVLELGEECIPEGQKSQVHNRSQLQALLCSHKNLLQVLRSQLAFVQHLFQREPGAMRCQEDDMLRLEVRAKALLQLSLEQDAASQRRIQEWARWEDSCGGLGRVLDDVEASVSVEPEGDDEKLIKNRHDGCQQTLVQLDESRAALGLILDQRKVLQTDPVLAATVTHTGGGLQLRWQRAYRRTEQEIQRCRDIQDSGARLQAGFASVTNHLVGSSTHLKTWSDLVHTPDPDQECIQNNLIKLLDFSMEIGAMSVQRASVSGEATKLLHLKEADCPGLRAQLAQLEVDWSQQTSDLSKIQEQLQQQLLASWPPVKLLSDLDVWLEKKEARLNKEKETILKFKDAAQVTEILQNFQEIKAGMANGQLLLDFLCQSGPQLFGVEVHALSSEHTMFAEKLGDLRWKWQEVQTELESQIHAAEQTHHTCADRERRLQHLHGWIEQQRKLLNEWKQPTCQTIARKALVELEAAQSKVQDVSAALQKLKSTRVHVEGDEDHPSDISMAGKTESVCHACGDLGQQMEALRPALKQTVEEWSSFERDVREVSLLATRVRCALLHQPPPLFSLKQAQGYMDILQQLQEDTRKGEELWASLDQSHQCLVKTIHCKAAKYLDNQVEEERKRWNDVLQELKDEHKKTEETLSLWQSYTQLSDQCSLCLQTLWHQWEDTQGSIHSMEQLHDAVEELQSSVGDVLAASKPLIGRLQPPAMDLIQSETRLLSRDVLLLSQAVSGKKISLQEDLEHQKLFHTHLEAIEKQTENIQHKLKNSLNDKNSVKGVLLELSDVFVSLVDVRELSGCVTLNDHQTERLHSLSTQWLQSMTHTSNTDRELQAEYQRCQNFEQMCGNMTSIQKKLEEELMSKKLQSYSSPQEMLAVYQRLQAETRVGQQLLQGLLHHAVESMETGEERSALMAKVTCMRESWLKTMALAGQWKSLTKEQIGHWRVYNLGLKRLWKLLRDVDPLLPPAGPALCALHQLPSCADDYKCVEDTLGLHSGVYSETLQAGRHLCENMEDSECRSRLQSELQAIEEAWVRSSSLLERRRELVNTTLQKWSQCQDLITTSMRQLDELKTVLKQLHDSEDEKHIQGTELSLQRLASGLRDLSTMKTDLSQYVAAGDSALLEQQLEQLHAQWEELRMKVSLRRQEIADRLNAWTIFNDKNKEFCDWLTQMENKVCHSGDLSIEEMVEKLKKDCMEEINLFSENKSHLKQLGEQLLLASDQAKQSQVHGSLQEVNLRWHNLFHHIEARVKKLKETLVTVQQLDKNMSNLRSWLSRIEADLSRPITYSVCHQQEIQKRLAEQQELQRDIEQHTEGVASVLSLCDVLLRDEDAAGGTETESDSLQETSRSLDQRWRTICALALDRRLRIEETSRLWSKFLDDYSRFEDWLKMAERTAANPNSADVLYTVAKEELKKFEGFQRQVHERLTQLELVNNQYRRLARENRTDRASHLKVMVHQGNRRWDVLHRRVAAVLRRLKYFTSQREEFEGTRESMLVWLTELDLQLTNVEHFSESDVHHKIQQLNSFQQDITLNTERIDGLIVFGENLIQRSSPQDAELIEDELEELHSYCQEVFSRLVRFHQRLSQPPMIREEEEFSTATFSMESSLELIGRPWLGRSQCSLLATPSHLLACPLERSGRETPVSVADSLPLEWDHTGDVGGSTSHEDDDEEEDEEDEEGRTYFSALSEVELTEIQEEFVEASEVIRASSLVSSRSIAAHESPRWRSQDDTETQPLHLDSEDHPEATPTLTSTPLKQGYLRLMTQCSGSIQDIKRVSLILDDDEQPEELGLTGIISSDKQSGVIERWELLEARSRSNQHTGPQDLQQLTSHLDDITSWLEKVMPELERLQHSDPAASVEDMAARAKELKEMQKMFTRYKSTMLSVNLRAQEAPELQERLAGMNRDWSRASTGLQQWDTGLRKTLMRCQEFHKTLHSLLLWLAHAESRRYAVDISHPDTPVKALQQHHSTLTDLQSELQGRQTQQASLQALWSQLQPEEEAEESTEAQEKLHVTGSKLKLLLCQVDQDLNNLQQRLGCESATNVQGATADPSKEATNSKKGSSSKRRKRDSSPPPSFFYRVLRAAFPLHLLLLFLLLLPCLIPLSESVPGCTGTNNFARSFYPMLRYTNGPPPT